MVISPLQPNDSIPICEKLPQIEYQEPS
jgi:hypothetical protein